MVGLGAMGRPIAEHIARVGFTTLAFDLSPNARAEGVTIVKSLADLAPADVVIVIVPTDEDVTDVVAGQDGLLQHGKPGLTVVISASVKPGTCRELAVQAEKRDIRVIDAALTGGVRGAENGEINLLVGGPRETADAVADVFAAFAKNYHVLGEIGAGQIGKSANNLIHWAQIVAIDESMRLAADLGVEARPHCAPRWSRARPTAGPCARSSTCGSPGTPRTSTSPRNWRSPSDETCRLRGCHVN